MITKLEPGERPWSAVREMISHNNNSLMDSHVSEHLRPMMPVIEEQARREDVQAQTSTSKNVAV